MGGTCYSIALMLAHNQFSSNPLLKTYNAGKPAGDAGGNGRVGAQKILIFESDGAPNTTATAAYHNTGEYQSYYSVRYNSNSPAGSEYPTSVNGAGDNSSTCDRPNLRAMHANGRRQIGRRVQHLQPPASDPLPRLRAARRQRVADAPGDADARPRHRRHAELQAHQRQHQFGQSPTCKPRSPRSSKTGSRSRSSNNRQACLQAPSNFRVSVKSIVAERCDESRSSPCAT